MKKVIVGIVVASMMFANTAFAASQAQRNTGCGLGTTILGNTGDDSLILQLVMISLNNISYNQTFGITSGTSQCKATSRVAENEKLKEFAVANLDNLAKDIAKGRGESLETLVELIGIADEDRVIVYTKLQSNFFNIFTSENIEATQVVDNIITVITG